ncbi:SDR family oxidoreductase [Archangium lansingense]|uniref:SDR family oxidoreductase n=1 Tax=Archangium lansingense TaxID=2995310 RepID=A0ABT4AAW6_9BACT|nr:SDR family oxidoreductase [Archangium lansinium]MCY1078811.1 SDR family oxidoreductase [Archangium lansinium]
MAPIALVTGTSTGIGLSTAVQLAKAGFEVIATLRNPEKAERLRARATAEGVPLDIRALDVESDESVRQCVREVLQRHGRIDVLVNNAGAGFRGSMEQTSPEALRRTMEVNFFGVWRVTQAVFPVMREQRSGRVISVSSIGGLIGQPFNDAYCAAKFAVEGFMESLAPVAEKLGIHISLIEPGPVSTEFVNNVLAASDGMTGELGPYRPLLEGYMSRLKGRYDGAQTGDDVAKIIVEVATTAQPHLRYLTSDAVRGIARHKYADVTGDGVLALTRTVIG